MITFEVKNNPDHKGGEFSYDLRSLAGSFLPEEKCKVLEREDWADKEGYPLRMLINEKEILNKTFSGDYTKEEIKREVYFSLVKETNGHLPWGILTGIRPAKIAYRLLVEKDNRQEAFEVLMDDYLVFPEKAELVLDVAANEHKLMRNIEHEKGYNIYIGIPFCPSICQYCSFSSYPYEKNMHLIGDYLDSLERELEFADEFASSGREKKVLHSVYVGGGTPTSLSVDEMKRLLDIISSRLPMDEVMEFSYEAGRPDSVDMEKLKVLKEFGVTRISINPQSMLEHTLKILGRTHTTKQVREAFRMAREAGFDDINMDIILGLPEEDEVDFYNTLNQIYDLGPDSVTVHTLVIKKASRFGRDLIDYGGEIRPEDTLIPVLQRGSYDFLKQRGYEPYYMYRQKNGSGMTRNTNQENVAYSRFGKECLYNIFIMEQMEDILGFGAGASSKHVIHSENRIERVENVKNVEEYIKRVDEMTERKRREFMKV